MDEAGDIAGISIPFTIGVAAGALAGGFNAVVRVTLAGASAIVLTLILFSVLRRKCKLAAFAALFACAGIFCSVSHSLVPDVAHTGWLASTTDRALAAFKSAIAGLDFKHDDTGALLCALLTGDRSLLGAAEVTAFRQAGASHILALSGLHLGVIYMCISRILSMIGNSPAACRARAFIIIILAAFYTLMTGHGPSIVRAFLFILINEICRLSPDREHRAVRVLLIALTIQLALDPDVIGSVGFQLSYLAMGGIVVLFPRLEAWYPEGRGAMRKLWQSTALTISCQVFTAPLVWIRFNTFPRYFIITNLLALPLTSLIMTLSIVSLALSALSLCPGFLLTATDFLVQALLFSLNVISGM